MVDDEKWNNASLSIHTLNITPEQIEELLGIKHSRIHHIGDAVSSRNNVNKHTNHFYTVDSNCSTSESIDKHLEALLFIFESKAPIIKEIAKTEDVVLFCGFSSGNGQGGFSLTPELLTRLASFGVRLSIDLYPPSEIENV